MMMDNKKTFDKIRICDKQEMQERIDFFLKHPEEITDSEMALVRKIKGVLGKFQEVQQALPFHKYVSDELQKLNSFDAKIIFLKEVIALWEVNAVNAEILNGDNTAKGVKDEHIKLYSAWLTYFQKMKELEEEVYSINAHPANNRIKGGEVHLPPPDRFTIKDNCEPVVKHVHQQLNDDAFSMTETQFSDLIECADFSTIYDKRKGNKAKIKYMISYLSEIMGSDWYKKAAESINCNKTQCSGANVAQYIKNRLPKSKIPSIKGNKSL